MLGLEGGNLPGKGGVFSLIESLSVGGTLWDAARLSSYVQIPFRCVNVTQAAVFADSGSHKSRNVVKQM